MQRLTNQIIGTRAPLSINDSENIRLRMSSLGYLDASIIIQTDNTVNVTIDKNIYNISTNLQIISENTIVSNEQTIMLNKSNFGIQEILVNMELTNDDPAYGEITEYTVLDNIITLNTTEFNNKVAIVKYLTTK